MNDTPTSSESTPRSTGLFPWLLAHGWRWQLAALGILAALTCFRFFYATSIELVADEAYYWLWSEHLDYCYYSKGPAIAWTIAAGTWLFGDTVFGIRFFAVLLSAGTGYFLYRLGRALFDAPTGFLALILAACVPLFAVGSVLMTIDPLSLFFWMLAALTFWRARDSDRWADWLLPGLWIGLGMLAKYTNIAELISFALFCLWSQPHRRHFRQPTFWTMTAVSLLSLTPPIIWNAGRNWITLQHLLDRGKLGPDDSFHLRPGEISQFLTEQLLVISPLLCLAIFATAFISLKRFLRNGKMTDRLQEDPEACGPWKFLLCLFWPLPAFYMLLSLNEAGEANWTAPAYLAGLILLAAFWRAHVPPRSLKSVFLKTALVLAFIQTVLLHQTHWLPLTQWGIPDPLDRVRGHQALANEIARTQRETGATFLVARRYQTAALISFYHPDRPPVYIQHSNRIENQFSFWPSYDEFMTNELSALFICRGSEKPRPDFIESFSQVSLLKEQPKSFRGRTIGIYRIFFCENFLGAPTAPPID